MERPSGPRSHNRTTQPGRIARADKGSLFLDEIESSPAWLQGTLLRVLEDMPRRPMLAGEQDMRLSLAGAQDKLPVVAQWEAAK